MTRKKLLTGMLIIALLILFTAGIKDKDGGILEQQDIVISSAGVIDTGSSSVNEEIQPAEAAIYTETPPVAVPVSKQTAVKASSVVKDANEEDNQQIPVLEQGNNPVPVIPSPEEPHEEPSAPSVHEHTWVDEIVAYHEAVTHEEPDYDSPIYGTKTVTDQKAWDETIPKGEWVVDVPAHYEYEPGWRDGDRPTSL